MISTTENNTWFGQYVAYLEATTADSACALFDQCEIDFDAIAVGCAPNDPACAPTPTPAPTATVTVAPTAQGPKVIIPTGTVTPSVLPPLEDVASVARVNDVEISSVTFGQELLWNAKLLGSQKGIDWYSPQGQALVPGMREAVLDNLIDQELLRQLAAAEGITVAPARLQAQASAASQALIQQLGYGSWEEFLKAFQISDEQFVESLRVQFLYEELVRRHGGATETDQVRIRHILVSTKEKGQEVMQRLAAGEAFEDVAQEMSEDAGTKAAGGLIEWTPRGLLPAGLEEAAFSLEVGKTSDLFETASGYHVIQVLGHEVRAVRGELLDAYRQRNFAQWFADQKAKADIEKYVTFLPPTPAP